MLDFIIFQVIVSFIISTKLFVSFFCSFFSSFFSFDACNSQVLDKSIRFKSISTRRNIIQLVEKNAHPRHHPNERTHMWGTDRRWEKKETFSTWWIWHDSISWTITKLASSKKEKKSCYRLARIHLHVKHRQNQ